MTPKLSLPTALKKLLDQPLLKGYGFPVGLIIIAFILLLFTVRPVFGRIMMLRKEQVAAQESLSALTTKVGQLENFASQSEGLDEEFKRFDQAVPSEISIPTLLTQVQTIANSVGVRIAVLQFGGAGGSTEEEAARAKRLNEVRLKLTTEGSFDNIVELLQTLETATRLIDVESVGYNTQETEGGVSTSAAELTLISYYTSKLTLLAEAPITFSFTDEAFKRNSQVLQRLTPYETKVP